ncbi:FAD-dependent oxidoreductase [SAR202 cluster bacterium AD-804-J14_MRT_500m]|nr:FAD-dependent oxidoreductase [SAR202 cluster bacterium AD-804-J14_MRT_500m]
MANSKAGIKYDVVVVGAGNAALTTAMSASQSGAKVLVLEKAPHSFRGGNSRFSGGLFRFAYESLEDLKPLRPDVIPNDWERVEVEPYESERYLDDIMSTSRGQSSTQLLQVLTQKSYDTMTWMTDLGVEWDWTALWSVKSEESLRFNPGTVLESKNKGVGLMAYLFRAVENSGIEVSYQAKMTRLMQDQQGSVCGVSLQTPNGMEDVLTKAVVLASGGFEANAEMRARYLGTGWDQVKVRGTRYNTGETLRMALEIGAKPVGHWQGCHATPIDGDAPAMGDLRLTDRTNRLSYPYSIMVNSLGKRFVDEGEDLGGLTYAKTGRAILNQPGAIAYQIFDAKTIHLLEERYSTGTPVVSETISGLAEGLGLPVAEMVSTIDAYNAAVQPGDFDSTKKDGKCTAGLEPAKSNWATLIDSPPYTSYPVACGITFTYGGVQIDPDARVIDTEDNPMPGLFATGEITGDFFYHNYPGGSGLMRGAVFGRIAGANAATFANG